MVDNMKKITIGILAHVDAGKTTLSEAMLYLSGNIRSLGRVDHRDTFFDTDERERARGITIFSKQASFNWKNVQINLVDTPGHVDFSSEMERTLQVLDYAVLVISGMDGIQSHTQTVWKLLRRYHIPTFIFVNKMDQRGVDRAFIFSQLRSRFQETIIPFDELEELKWQEEIALLDEKVLDYFMENGSVPKEIISGFIKIGKVVPVYFGSALKLDGVESFLDGIAEYSMPIAYPEEFGARVYKITRDEQNNRLTHLKITGGSLKVKSTILEEKINQIRFYDGVKFTTKEEAVAGDICTVTGLTKSFAGQGLGRETQDEEAYLEPILEYQVILPEGSDLHKIYENLKQLQEEDPKLHLIWDRESEEIRMKLMGEVQIEILKQLILERFGIKVDFSEGSIVYKETIKTVVEGVGHFEPLKHYAEVHLLMEPLPTGSGLIFDSICREDVLDLNWQRLILTHLAEVEHRGVLLGAPITDMRIQVLSGRAHNKHTEGGDFRQATYRAIRQGLMQAKSILLEPYYSFRLELPMSLVGRAMTDIQNMHGNCELLGEVAQADEMDEPIQVLTGSAPVACMRSYLSQVNAYSGGRGRLFLTFKGYEPCHNEEEVLANSSYQPELDMEHPVGSVFCSHGSGIYVNWDQVFQYMHVPLWLKGNTGKNESQTEVNSSANSLHNNSKKTDNSMYGSWESDRELEEIFERTFGKIKQSAVRGDMGYEREQAKKRQENIEQAAKEYRESHSIKKEQKQKDHYVLVDGYNVIFAWEELKELAKDNLESARGRLMDILCNYQGFHKCILIVVFDAYKVKNNPGEISMYHNIHVVYTKEAETADMYIEKTTKQLGHKENVTVISSDGLEQIIVAGHGAKRKSSREFLLEIQAMEKQLREEYMA